MGRVKQYLSPVLGTLLSVAGIALLLVGSYFTGFGWAGLASIAGGLFLFVIGILLLRRQESRVSDKLSNFLEMLFMLS